ncbi:MAG: response regulator transcription factor [Xanthomonadales bacterium]|nr:response regulator transcription factor [Xanthomonadales bacterium]
MRGGVGSYAPMSAEVTIAIVEDDDITRAALVARLATEPRFSMLFEAERLSVARAQLDNAIPDVLIVDLGLPDGSGLELISEVATKTPDAAILVLTVFGDEEKLIRAFERGARGYLLKDETSIGLVDAIDQLLAGGAPISPAIARYLIQHLLREQAAIAVDESPPGRTLGQDLHPDSRLSAREIEVLRLAARGYNHAEVARLLALSTHTVASYTRRIYEKLEVHSRAEALFEANRLGLIDQQDG